MTTRDTETQMLHGPWGGDTTDEVTLEQFRDDFPKWRFWRAMRQDRTAGDWNAQRISDGKSISALTSDELRARLKAERQNHSWPSTAEELGEVYPDWNIFPEQRAGYVAERHRPLSLTPAAEKIGLVNTLRAPTLEDLQQRLARQDHLVEQSEVG